MRLREEERHYCIPWAEFRKAFTIEGEIDPDEPGVSCNEEGIWIHSRIDHDKEGA